MTTRRRSLASARRVERATGRLTTAALGRMNEELPWFRELPAEHRSWVGLVASAGISSFVGWLRAPGGGDLAFDVFGAAPRELARVISLRQAVELVRVTVDTVEDGVAGLAAPGETAEVREAILRFSREVAFAAARVYAAAAEERGAWHARLRALLVDSLLRGDAPETVRARSSALGWAPSLAVVVVAGTAPAGDPEAVLDDAERACRSVGVDALCGLDGDRLVVVAGHPDPLELAGLATKVADGFADGPVVVGPVVDGIGDATTSARQALAALRVVTAWPGADRPVDAADLLPERALDGDPEAVRQLLEDVYNPLVACGEPVLKTVATYVELGESIERSARALYLHPNTVRYRLRKAIDATGLVVTEPRGAFVARIALVLGRLAAR